VAAEPVVSRFPARLYLFSGHEVDKAGFGACEMLRSLRDGRVDRFVSLMSLPRARGWAAQLARIAR